MRYANPSKKTRVIASVRGHAVEFPGRGTVARDSAPKGVLVDDEGHVFVPVPPVMQAEVVSAGLIPESEFQEPAESKVPKRPEGSLDFQKDLFAAFDIIVEANERDAFAGTGVPKPAAVEKVLGYAVTNAELKDQWPKYLAGKKE